MNLKTNTLTIQALKSGDSKAYATIYADFYKPLCRFCTRYVPQAEAEEIVQDLMLKIWEHRDRLQESLSLKSFLYTCAKHQALNTLYRAYLTREVYTQVQDHAQEEQPAELSFLHTELYHAYEQTFHSLPKEQQQAFALSRYQHLTHQQIADNLHVSVQTVNYRIGKALHAFRIKLKEFFPG